MPLLLLMLLVLGCSSGSATQAPPAAAPVPVEVAAVRGGGLSASWTVPGDVRALERADLAAGADGTVTSVSVREGDDVTAGQVLAEVDAAIVRAELAAARATHQAASARRDRAHTNAERVRKVAPGVLAEDEVDATLAELAVREAELAQADAAVRLAAARRARHQVVAPFPGTVARRAVDVGDWVAPGTPMLQLVRVDGVEIVIDAPADLVRAVAPGDAVTLPGGTAGTAGRVAGVVPALDVATRTGRLRVVPDAPESLLPGSTIDVTFAVQRSGGLVVPRDAVVESADELRVFRVVEGTAQPVRVQLLARAADELLVSGDLSEGDVLVVRGNERLRPDQPVSVLE